MYNCFTDGTDSAQETVGRPLPLVVKNDIKI